MTKDDDLVKRLWLHDCEGITREAADRIEALEAKLAKAVEALEKIAQHDMQYWAITTLAELKGETDK